MINVNIIRDLVRDVTAKDKINSSDKNTVDFKEIVNNKKQELSKNEVSTEVSDAKTDLDVKDTVLKEVGITVGKIEQALESNNEEEVIEEVVSLLNLLNVNIVNQDSLPIVIEVTEPDKQIITLNNDITRMSEYNLSYDEAIVNEDLINGQIETSNISDGKDIGSISEKDTSAIKEILDIMNENSTLDISEDEAKNIKKLIDIVLPLIKESNGDEINKTDILQSIKSKIENMNLDKSEGTKKEDILLNSLNLKVNNIVEKNLHNSETSSDLSNENFRSTTAQGLSEEDKILNKAMGIETTNDFSQVLNRLSNRNDIHAEKTIAPRPVFKETMDEDLVKNIRFMARNEVQELKVKIYPKELGEMTIKILSEEGIMRAEIKATSKETYNLLNSNMNEIKKLLSNESIKIQEVNIGLYNEDTTYYGGQGYQEGSHDSNKRYVDSSSDNYIRDYDDEVEEITSIDTSNVDLLV